MNTFKKRLSVVAILLSVVLLLGVFTRFLPEGSPSGGSGGDSLDYAGEYEEIFNENLLLEVEFSGDYYEEDFYSYITNGNQAKIYTTSVDLRMHYADAVFGKNQNKYVVCSIEEDFVLIYGLHDQAIDDVGIDKDAMLTHQILIGENYYELTESTVSGFSENHHNYSVIEINEETLNSVWEFNLTVDPVALFLSYKNIPYDDLQVLEIYRDVLDSALVNGAHGATEQEYVDFIKGLSDGSYSIGITLNLFIYAGSEFMEPVD